MDQKITPKINEPLKNWNNQKIHYGAITNPKFIQIGFMKLIFAVANRDISVYTVTYADFSEASDSIA